MAGRSDVRVLVVEDDYLISALIQGILTQLGYTVAGWASGGELAVEMAESLRPDVILMDMKLPDTDGIEATRRIQERRPTPVVMMTAYDNAGFVQRASDAGVCAYLVKPPDAGQIERALIVARARFEDLMELRRLNGQLREEIAERRFAAWTMGQVNLAKVNPSLILKYSQKPVLDPYNLSGRASLALLEELIATAQIMGRAG